MKRIRKLMRLPKDATHGDANRYINSHFFKTHKQAFIKQFDDEWWLCEYEYDWEGFYGTGKRRERSIKEDSHRSP